jgi:membrane protein required for colicin V production
MIIDIIYVVLIAIAIFKGFSKGLIVALFSMVAYIIGLAAALKLSVVVAGWLADSGKVTSKWLPLLSFIIVFIGVVLLVRLGAALIQKTFQVAMLGWLNRIGGAVFYIIFYTIVFSVFLFFAESMRLVSIETVESSITYNFVQPWGPMVINNFGKIIPLFEDMFAELQEFFGRIAEKTPPVPQKSS